MKRSAINHRMSYGIFYLSLLAETALFLPVQAQIGKPPPPPSYDLESRFIENIGFVAAGDAGQDFTNKTIRHMAVSIGQLGGINPETGQVILNQDNLLPLVAQELDIVGSAYFYTNIHVSGDTFVYGTFYGSGAGISNIPVTSLTGSLTERPEIQSALDSKLDSVGVWETLNTRAAEITMLQLLVSLLDQSVSDTNNPHQATAEQIGAYSKAETTALVSNALAQVQSVGYIATNHTGNVSITGRVNVLSLQVTSNIIARVFYGDGSGLTNLPAASITGSLAERPEIQSALDAKLDADGVWTSIGTNTAHIAGLQSNVAVLGAVTSNTNNHHQVTARQAGALSISGGTMGGHIDMALSHRLINLPDPANDKDAVTKSYLDRRLNFIPPQGDLEMGTYTNRPGF